MDTKESLSINRQNGTMVLLDNHPDPVVFYLPIWSEIETTRKIIDFQIEYTNQKAATDFQIVSGLFLSEQVLENLSGESSLRMLWFNQMQHVVQCGEKIERQYYNTQTKRYFNLICTKVQEGVLATVRDVTNEVKATHQAELDTRILNATSNGLLVLEAVRNAEGEIIDFIFVKANQPFTRFFEWNETFIGKSYSSLLPEPQELFRLKCRVIETGEIRTHEYYYNCDGENRWFHMALSKLSEEGLVATFTDITETKKQKEAQIQRNNNRMQIIFDTARAGMYTLTPVRDEHGEIVDFRFGLVNQAVASYLGLLADDLAGSLGSLHFPAYKSNGLFDRYVETMKTGNPAIFDLHYMDGYDNFFTINVVKLGDELFGTFTDHSPMKRLQRELEASIAELKRSNASLEQFAHAASHDLQEPLRKITVYTSKLEEHHADELTDVAFGYLERIKTASKRMQRLIKDLLVFAEVGANRPGFEDVDLNTLLQEVVNDLEVSIAEREAVIEIGNLGKIKGDSLHLQQLFQNLISNSIKYCRPEVAPYITITATLLSGKETGFVLGEYEAAKDFWQIRLQDNGQGFNNEQAKQIFKIFQRLPQHRNEYTGTGIGLAIVQRVVQNHKGYIKAEGIPGEGATFTILLPVTP